MMPIIHLQRRLREVGRIRLGVQVAAGNSGKKRPEKLDRFRLTSRDELVIRAAAGIYGGEVKPWKAPDGQQWEVITETAEMPVVVPPGDMSFTQWYELWSAGGCQRRCDGVTEHISERACVCDLADPECNMTSRLNVLLPDVPGFGLWRVESHGYYAATELAGVVEMCTRASAAGHMLPARLRLEQRMVKRIRDGKANTFRFAVPVLDLDVSVSTLGALGGGPSVPVAELGREVPALPAAGPGWKPVGELPEGPSASVAEQLAEVEEPKVRAPRANSQVPMGRSGLKPRTAQEATTGERAPEPAGDEPDEEPTGTISEKDLRHLHAVLAKVWDDDETRKVHCLDLVEILDGGRHTSRSDIPAHVVAKLLWALEQCTEVEGLADDLLDGVQEVYLKASGGIGLRRAPGQPTGSPAAAGPVAEPAGDVPGSEEGWRTLMKEHGKKPTETMRQANVLAASLKVSAPATIGEIPDAPVGLQGSLAAWVRGEG